MLKLMKEQLEFIKFVSGRLDAMGIPYMLTGSVALAVYAEPRMTRDIDLVIECRPGDANRIVAEFEPECYLDPQTVHEAIANRTMFNIIHQAWVVKADIIVRKEDRYREVEFQRRQSHVIDGVPLWITAPEDLILSKLAWSQENPSATQTGDVRALLQTVPDLDWTHLEKWATHLGVHQTLQTLRSS